MEKLNELIDYLKKIEDKKQVINILEWEKDTIVPVKARERYIELITKLNVEVFHLETAALFEKLLDNFINSEEITHVSVEEKTYYLELYNKYKRKKQVPAEFYERYTRLCSVAKNVWEDAKNKSNYEIFKPYLIDLIKLTKEYYRLMYPTEDVYNAMLNEYEKGMLKDDIDKLFEELKKEIIPLVKNLKINEVKGIRKKLSVCELKEVAKYLLQYIGFDMDRGALGVYPHGYTETLTRDDVRIAFSSTDNLVDHCATIIHEGGHGIFEQSVGNNVMNIPGYDIECYALHESQSRFYENILGRNINFWIPIFEDIKKLVSKDFTIQELMMNLNNAHPSLIRTEADELTYCLHIIIRYEIERDLFSDKISVEELPEVWNQLMQDYLGIKVENDSDGVLQDVHWACGNFGYFPSYLIGSIFDGMLLKLIEEKLGSVDEILKSGRIKEITSFLQENIHQYGGTFGVKEVANNLCHSELTIEPLVEYFKKKYQ